MRCVIITVTESLSPSHLVNVTHNGIATHPPHNAFAFCHQCALTGDLEDALPGIDQGPKRLFTVGGGGLALLITINNTQ